MIPPKKNSLLDKVLKQKAGKLQKPDENANPNLMEEECTKNPKTYYEERFNDAIGRTVDGIMESLDFDDVTRHYDLENIQPKQKVVFQNMFSMLREGLQEELMSNFAEIGKKFNSNEFFQKKFEFEERRKIGNLVTN